MADINKVLVEATKVLVSTNTALPVVVSLIDGLVLLFKGAGVDGPTVAERAEIIRANVQAARTYRDEELKRLDELIAARQAAAGGHGTDD